MYVQKTNQDAASNSLLVPELRETPFLPDGEVPAITAQILDNAVGAAETIDAISIDGTSYTLDGSITAANIGQLSAQIDKIVKDEAKYLSAEVDGYDVEFRALRSGTNVIGMAVGELTIDSITFSTAGVVSLTENATSYRARPYEVIVDTIAVTDGVKVDGSTVYAPASSLVAGTDTAAAAELDLQLGLAAANADNISSHIDRIEVTDIEVSGSPNYRVRLWIADGSTVAINDGTSDVAGTELDGASIVWFNN